MKTANHGLGRTTIKQTVLDRLWADAVRQQVRQETISAYYPPPRQPGHPHRLAEEWGWTR